MDSGGIGQNAHHLSDTNQKRQLKSYSAPKVNKLTPEQAVTRLTVHALMGDTGAKTLLRMAKMYQGSIGRKQAK